MGLSHEKGRAGARPSFRFMAPGQAMIAFSVADGRITDEVFSSSGW
jgi:hypothetical protein